MDAAPTKNSIAPARNAPRRRKSREGLGADLSALTKPRITMMVVLTTAVGYVVASPDFDWRIFLHTLAGTAALASGSSVYNQWVERRNDARMQRTAQRPLPAGRMHPAVAFLLASTLSVVGFVWLWLWVNALTAWVGAATLALYVIVYTPMKRWTSLNTVVGAVPGAMPPMMGCTAATETLSPIAWALFGILFLWQMPHFLAIAWLYRTDYEAGGLPMLPVGDPDGRRTSLQMALYSIALAPVSILPTVLGFTGLLYLIGALLAGAGYSFLALRFGRSLDARDARKLLLASVAYLPAVLILMVVDRAAL
ncbi:MAG: heme o synthase [Thermoanaerobaculia bacterium]|nr:heme o synthase [Thermoanaerobaculia bacterium]